MEVAFQILYSLTNVAQIVLNTYFLTSPFILTDSVFVAKKASEACELLQTCESVVSVSLCKPRLPRRESHKLSPFKQTSHVQ